MTRNADDLLGRLGNDLDLERKILNGFAWLCGQYQEKPVARKILKVSLAEAIELIRIAEIAELESMAGKEKMVVVCAPEPPND